MWGHAEAQQEIIVADVGGDGGETFGGGGEIEIAIAFVNLHGIAPAHGDVRLRLAFEISEFAMNAYGAFGIARDADGVILAGPHVKGNETSFNGLREVAFFDKKLDGFGGLNCGDYARGRSEDADGVAGVFRLRRR